MSTDEHTNVLIIVTVYKVYVLDFNFYLLNKV